MPDRVVKVVLRADASQLTGQLDGLSRRVKGLSDEMAATGHSSTRALRAIGDSARSVALVTGASLGAIVLATAKFDKEMSAVQAATHETAKNMDLLRGAAIQAGADTAFSASEAAQGIEALAKAGVSTSDILAGGLAGSLDLAAAGGIGVGDAAEYAARAMTQFSLAGDQVPHIADLLSAAAGKAVGEVGDFGQALNQAGLVASQTGLSIEDTVGTLAAFAQAGLQGSDAGTSFKSMLQRLQNPLGQGAKAMEALGINAYDATGNFIGITGVAGELHEKLDGLTQAQRDAALAQIFGSDAVRAATVLYRDGADGIQKWIDKTNEAGYAAETAATRMDNLAGDFEQLKGSLETLLIRSGEGQTSFFRSMTQGATDATNAIAGLPPVVGDTVVSMLGITAITAGGAWFGSRVIRSVAETRKAMAELNITAGRTRRILRGAAAGIAGLAVANSDLAEQTGLSNTASYALYGTIAGPWGAAIGGGIGLVKDFAGANNDLEAALKAVDDVLSDGTLKQTSQQLADLRQELDDLMSAPGLGSALHDSLTELSLGPLMSGFNANKALITSWLSNNINQTIYKIQDLQNQLRELKNSSGGVEDLFGAALPHQLGLTERALDTATESAEEFKDSLESVNAVLEGRANLRDYKAALDDFTASLKENGHTLNINTKEGRANQESLDRIAGTALQVAENLEGMDRVHYLQRARKDFIDAAMDAGKTRHAAQRLADKLGLLAQITAKPKVKLEGTDKAKGDLDDVKRKAHDVPSPIDILLDAQDHASGTIDHVQAELARIPRTVTSVVNVARHVAETLVPGAYAAGGLVSSHAPAEAPAAALTEREYRP